MTWTGLVDIDGAAPLDDCDRAVLDDIRAVLDEHGALKRFGVTLLHSHFDVADDEVLVERVDVEARTLTTRPVPVAEAGRSGAAVETSWRLDAPDGRPRCVTYCHRPPNSTIHAT